MNHEQIQVILVPAGAEYQAVLRALRQVPNSPQVMAIPAGPAAVRAFFTQQRIEQLASAGVLLVGLGGSLSSKHRVGQGLMLKDLWDPAEDGGCHYACDRDLTEALAARLALEVGVGVTCDRVITTTRDKQQLRERYGADVVDMEGAALLQALPSHRLAMLRVISDGCDHDLPDIAGAIGLDGSLQRVSLAWKLLKRPVSAWCFIQGAITGLRSLERLMVELFRPYDC